MNKAKFASLECVDTVYTVTKHCGYDDKIENALGDGGR
jgi:hypothetical protein